MLQPLDEVEEKFVALDDPQSAIDSATAADAASATSLANLSSAPGTGSATDDAGGDSDHLPHKKRQKKMTGGPHAVTKELSAEQKAIVKMNVTRDATTDGFVKCCYCEKEISSKNVDRWASHLRGCLKAPDEVKAQIQPFRPAQAAVPGATGATGATPAAPTAPVAGAMPLAAPSSGLPVSCPATTAAAAAAAGTGVAPVGQLMTGAMSGIAPVLTSGYNEVFKVHVSKDYMKFNAAHFIAYKGFRERLHGHNYRVAVTITGTVGADGYVVDFGEIKKIARVICKDLNESFLVPMNSDALKITFDGTNVHIVTEDNAKFSFPKADCSLLPIIHSSAEELAIYISNQIIEAFTVVALLERNVRKLEVSISEAHMQMASYERSILPGA